MRFAYADPPYLGCCGLYEHYHPDGRCWDDIETHGALVDSLMERYPDGWALSLSAPSLIPFATLLPPGIRVCSWVKPFAAFKRNVRVAYTWEPVVVYGGRLSSADGASVTRDHLAEPITMRKGFVGAKPERFCRWVLDLLGYCEGDQLDDLYPGTGVMGRVLNAPTLPLLNARESVTAGNDTNTRESVTPRNDTNRPRKRHPQK